MTDVFTRQKRSEVMSRIRSRGNRDTELAMMALLKQNRITGWRRHLPLVGRPDFTFRKQRVVVFVDGCFWHQCPKCNLVPANNAEFWRSKLGRNRERDREVTRTLELAGWKVVRIWEHDFKQPKLIVERLSSVLTPGLSVSSQAR